MCRLSRKTRQRLSAWLRRLARGRRPMRVVRAGGVFYRNPFPEAGSREVREGMRVVRGNLTAQARFFFRVSSDNMGEGFEPHAAALRRTLDLGRRGAQGPPRDR